MGAFAVLAFAAFPAALGAEEPRGATGTAFVVGKGGYLLTCAHVVRDAVKVRVSIGGKSYDAAVLSVDDKRDLALLQVSAKDLPPLPLANSNAVELGQEVRAFGFPIASVLGVDIKVTKGSLSGDSRREARKVFQIDAAVNHGNSGGPLVNETGEVIGVVNAGLTGPSISNVSFAVPINYAKQLLSNEGVEFEKEGAKEKLDGPALVKRVSPAVAFVVVWRKGADHAGPRPPDTVPGPKPQLAVDLGGGVKMELVIIPPGSFEMGSEKGGQANEKPVHKVTFKKPFCIGKYEVTQEQWQAVMGANPSKFKDPKKPVDTVSWNACRAFVTKLSEKTSRKFSLPSEAEWEYACRAGSTSEFCSGDGEEALGEYAWHSGNSGDVTHPVGQRKPNKWGIFDMHGNVWEWCEDMWHESYEGAPTDGSAWVEGGDQLNRLLRGGSWSFPQSRCRSAVRHKTAPTRGPAGPGCRVVLRDF